MTRLKTHILTKLLLHGIELESVPSAKYLGVTISEDLSWSTHINNTSMKANQALGFIKRDIRVQNKDLKSTAYKTLVRPQLERYHDLPKRTGTEETDRNRPKRTHGNTETDFCGYRNGPERIPDFSGFRKGPEQTSAHTETNFSMVEMVGWGTIGTILIKSMYVLVCMYVCMHVYSMYVCM